MRGEDGGRARQGEGMKVKISRAERIAFAAISSAWSWLVAWFYHAVQVGGCDAQGWLHLCWFFWPVLGHTIAGYVVLIRWLVRIVDPPYVDRT